MPRDVLVCSGCGRVWDNSSGEQISGVNNSVAAILYQKIVCSKGAVLGLSRTSCMCVNCRCEVIFPVLVLSDSSV